MTVESTEAHDHAPVEHSHSHGTGEGQHSHGGWLPDRVIERMKRDGLCGHQVSPTQVCMHLATADHQH